MRLRLIDRSAPKSDQLLQIVATGVILLTALLALPALLVPLGLPIEGDAVDYRVPLLRWMLRHATYPNFSWTMVDDYPMLGELLMLPLFFLHPALARLVPILAYLALGIAGGEIAVLLDRGRSNHSRRALFLMGMAWALSFRPLLLQSNVLMVDNLASAFFLFAGIFAVRGRAGLAGLCAACGLATRYNVWGSVAALPLIVFYFAPKRKAVSAVLFCAIAALGAVPFMVRNYFVNHGHLFFPVDAPEIMSQWGVLQYGRGQDFLSFLLLPFDLLYTNSYVSGIFDYTLGKLFYVQLAAVAFALGIALWRTERPSSPGRIESAVPVMGLWLLALVHLLIWFRSSQQLRFLVPSLIVLNMGMLVFVAQRVHRVALVGLTMACMLSVVSVQRDSLAIAFGRVESPFESGRRKAEECFRRAGVGSEVLAFVHRDGVLGYFDHDFVFLPGHPYYVNGSEVPKVSWLYAETATVGYEAWPKGNPCLQRRIKS